MFSGISSWDGGAAERHRRAEAAEGTPSRSGSAGPGDGARLSRRSVAASVAVLAVAPIGASFRLPSVGAAPSGPIDDGGERGSPTNEELAARFFEELHTAGDLDVAEEIVAQTATIHTPDGDLAGPEGIRALVTMFRSAFPDAAFPMEDMVSVGDRVIVRWSMSGTSHGVYQGFPPTGEPVTTTGITVLRIKAGRIAEDWVQFDGLGLLKQLGVVMV